MEEPGVGLDHPAKDTPEQQAPRFLQDVIFHGKFKVSEGKTPQRPSKAASDDTSEIS